MKLWNWLVGNTVPASDPFSPIIIAPVVDILDIDRRVILAILRRNPLIGREIIATVLEAHSRGEL